MAPLPLYWGTDEEAEDIERYTSGGFHPISLGDVMTADSPAAPRYRILHKLGHGAYSTVWLAEVLHAESQRYVALKVCIADADPQHERQIFSRLSHNETRNVLQLLDSFSIQGPNGLHTILVHNVLGRPTPDMRSPTRGGHKMLCRQIAQGLATLHGHGIAHGGNVGIALPTLNNHRPENILRHFGRPDCTIIIPKQEPPHPEALPRYLVPPISIVDYLTHKDPTLNEIPPPAEILDLGNAVVVEEQSRPFCTPHGVCAPELMFELVVRSVKPSPTPASDIWSFACTIFELIFEQELFNHASPNDKLLGRMAKLCGEVPPSWKSYWESREYLRSMTISHEAADVAWKSQLVRFTEKPSPPGGLSTNPVNLSPWRHSLPRVERKLPSKENVSELFGLLRFMLKIDPGCRPSAEEVLQHPWFAPRVEASAKTSVSKLKVMQKAPRDVTNIR